MLSTDLEHVVNQEQFEALLKENNNVMLCCGRMGPMCIPVYRVMSKLKARYPHVCFADMEFDIPLAANIRNLPQCGSFMGLPFTVYYKQGKVVKATSSIQNEKQVVENLDICFKEQG